MRRSGTRRRSVATTASKSMPAITRSRSPAAYAAGTATWASRQAAVSAQLRSWLRYQFSPPVKPRRAYSADEGVEVGLGEPVREDVRLGAGVEEAATGRHGERGGRAGAARRRQQPAERRARVRRELRIRHARPLEVQLVVVGAEAACHRRRGRPRAARQQRHRQRDDPLHAVGPQERGVPGDRRAPVVSHDDRPLGAHASSTPSASPTWCRSV